METLEFTDEQLIAALKTFETEAPQIWASVSLRAMEMELRERREEENSA